MEVIICPDGDEVARIAAETVAQVCRRVGPSVVLGVATGSSPLALYRDLGVLAREGKVAVSPGAGFGPGGEGFVRFALVENEHRIRQAVRGIRRVLEAGPP